MLNYIYDVKDKLQEELKRIEFEERNIIKQAELSIYLINKSLNDIKNFIYINKFQSQLDEIQFFKKVKPSIYSKLIYFVKIFNIESKRPNGSDKSQKKYLLNELNKLEKYFSENLEFYQYMRNDMTFLDDKYFVRGKLDLRLYVDTFIYDADPDFSTSHDYKVAKILANDLLSIYLKSELSALDWKENTMSKNALILKGKYAWTDSKIALTELIYAINSIGSINDGNVDIKEMAALAESWFKIDLGDFYRDYMQIKGRQNPTKYLDSLKAALLKRMDEQDK